MASTGKRRVPLVVLQGRLSRDLPLGTKARGIAALPPAWVPPFAALTPSFVEKWRQSRSAAAIVEVEWSELIANLVDGGRYLLVRSDGPVEGQVPGEGRSLAVPASPAALTAALDEALQVADQRNVDALPLIQAAVEPALLGVMSNERRLVRRRDDWLVEGALRLRGQEQKTIRAVRGTVSAQALAARSPAELLASLRIVARRLGNTRIRCEWVWDGVRVWVVQADHAPAAETPDDVRRYLAHRSSRPPNWRDKARRPKVQGLRKLAAYTRFLELGWPVVPIEAARASEVASPRDLIHWCDWLTHERFPHETLVVRTDLVGADEDEGALLPTSEPVQSSKGIRRFLDRAHGELTSLGKEPAFLVSPLVRARASAMARAGPSEPTVDVDALWGFPDGLLISPHDTYQYDSRSSQIEMRTRFKPGCLILDERSRRHVPLSAPWDWGRVLRRDELEQIADWARQLAEWQRGPIQLMALARIGGARGAKACLPFHFTGWSDQPAASTAAGALRGVEPVLSLRGRADLRRAETEQAAAYKLELDAGHLRDTSLLREVGALARRRNVPVLFAGSLLGHAYYVLSRTGAVVLSAGDDGTPAASDCRATVVRRPYYPDRVYPLPQAQLERLRQAQPTADAPLGREAAQLRSSAFKQLSWLEASPEELEESPGDWLQPAPRVAG